MLKVSFLSCGLVRLKIQWNSLLVTMAATALITCSTFRALRIEFDLNFSKLPTIWIRTFTVAKVLYSSTTAFQILDGTKKGGNMLSDSLRKVVWVGQCFFKLGDFYHYCRSRVRCVNQDIPPQRIERFLEQNYCFYT